MLLLAKRPHNHNEDNEDNRAAVVGANRHEFNGAPSFRTCACAAWWCLPGLLLLLVVVTEIRRVDGDGFREDDGFRQDRRWPPRQWKGGAASRLSSFFWMAVGKLGIPTPPSSLHAFSTQHPLRSWQNGLRGVVKVMGDIKVDLTPRLWIAFKGGQANFTFEAIWDWNSSMDTRQKESHLNV